MTVPKKKFKVITGHMHTKHWEIEAYDKGGAEAKLEALLESLEYDKTSNQYLSNVFAAVVMAVESPDELDNQQRGAQLDVVK